METKKLHGVWAGPMHAADLKVGQRVRDRIDGARGRVLEWCGPMVRVGFGDEAWDAPDWVHVRYLDLYVNVGEGTVTP